MHPLLDRLHALDVLASDLVDGDAFASVDDERLLLILSVAARIHRRVDAVLVGAVGEVIARLSTGVIDDKLTSRFGCHDVGELVQRTTLLAPASAHRLARAAKAVVGERALVSGEQLEPALPALRRAMLSGAVGVDGILAIATPLLSAGGRVPRDAVREADQILAATALRDGPDGAPPACADLLRVQALAWQAVLDQDGAEPRDRLHAHRRGVTLGAPTDSGVPIRGTLLPEVAAQFRRLCDALLSPRVRFTDEPEEDVDFARPVDPRTRAQKHHDVLATALTVAAASGELPTVGGGAPTLVVSVREEDLVSGRGYAYLDGDASPVSLVAAGHIGCGSVIQRVALSPEGRIRRLGTEERVFNRHQRRAIALRDGGCIIPGCGIAAGWCEIHHVVEHARGGPTHTDNGVLLCWFHHRYLDRSGWSIRMNRGVPQVRAPLWWDSGGRWRTVTTSPTRLRDAVRRT
ncbi:DUF222 domain-containing protein [Planococcus sp. APC 4015]|nr:DUF222 domain-containing protein [Planococcus sp. APC 4015]